MKMLISHCLCLLVVACSFAQEMRDTRTVGILSFAAGRMEDSVAAKNIYAAVARVLIQTKRFTILEADKWKLTQDEINKQRSAGFLERDVIQQGKSLGANVLIVGFVKNVEVYMDKGSYAARVDYELKYIDVETGKSTAAGAFKGDSKDVISNAYAISDKVKRTSNPLSRLLKKDLSKVGAAGDVVQAATQEDKITAIQGKIVDAIDESARRVNAWVRNTFNFNLMFLKMADSDGKNASPAIVVEGGEDIGMEKGCKLKMVLITEIETARGKIRDEEHVADLEVDEVRTETSRCKIIRGGKNEKAIQDAIQSKNMRIIFK